MRWDEWRFSARLAWQDRWVRWTMICTVLFYIIMTSFILARLLPQGMKSGVITTHYNIYLGIDEVRAWPWVFLSPGIMLAVLLANYGIAFEIFRHDELAARTLIIVASVIALLWGVSSFFITAVNL